MELKAEKRLGANHITNENGETVATAVDQQTAELLAAAPKLLEALRDMIRANDGEIELSDERAAEIFNLANTYQ